MNQKNIVHGSVLFFAGALLMSCSGVIRKPEPKKFPIYVTKVQATDSRGNKIVDRLTPREKYSLNVELINFGEQAIPAGKIQMRSSPPQVRMEKSNAQIPTMAPFQRVFPRSSFEFSVSKDFLPSEVIFSGQGVSVPNINFSFNMGEYLNPQISSDSVQIFNVLVNDPPPGGNGDQRLNPGETVNLFIQLRNIGNRFIDTSRAIISTPQSGVTIIDSSITFPPIPPGEVVTSSNSVRLFVASNYPLSGVPLKMTFTQGMQGEKLFILAVLNDIIVCVESISITRGSWLPGCLSRNPDLLRIRLSLCNETANILPNVVAQILASNIRFCRGGIIQCQGNLNQCLGNNERVYFGLINNIGYHCAQAKTPCIYIDGGAAHSVPYSTEFTYKVTNLPPDADPLLDPKLCLSFDIELFYGDNADNADNITNCQRKNGAIADWHRIIGASTNIPPIPPRCH